MNNNHQDFDDELVRWTDQILAGNPIDAPDDLGDLADVVRQIKQTIAPEHPPTPAFRANLQMVLLREWARRPQQKHPRFAWSHSRVFNLSMLAASLAAVLFFVTLLIEHTDDGENAVQGTSTGTISWFFGILVAVVVIVGIGVWFFKGRGKS